MESITLIVTALAAGAAAGTKATASEAVKDAYKGLVELIKKKFQGKTTAEMVLAEHEKKPDDWEKPLKTKLIEAGVDKDEEIINLAKKLMEIVSSKDAATGKYNTSIAGNAVASAFGDQAQVTNKDINFGVNPSEK